MTDTPQQFIDWFVKNYPGPDTVIFDPKWHAPKIYRAAIAPAYSEITETYRSSLRMIREAIETIFGPMANLESEEAELLRGPEPHHTAEAIIAALQNVAAIPRERREVKEIIAAQVQSVCDWDDRTSPDDCPNHLLITPEELKEMFENVADLASDRIRSCLIDKPEAVEAMDWGQKAFDTATEILTYLGIGTEASGDPGIDRRRDRICQIIDAALSPADAGAAQNARRKAFEEAAEIAEEFHFMKDIEWWLNSTKKEISAETCLLLAAAIRQRAQEPTHE